MVARKSGTDIALGDRCSRVAYAWAKKTFPLRAGRPGATVAAEDGGFANLVEFEGIRIGMTSDGIGTKIEIAERLGLYDTLGHDLVAMVVDDLAANGITPTGISNILDVDYLNEEVVDQLMKGLHEAAVTADIVVTGGEIAELGNRISGWGTGMHFNWCSTAIGTLPPGMNPIDGRGIAEGDLIVALQSRGFRSNGFSLLRKLLSEAFGDNWHSQAWCGRSWGEILLTPSLIYAPLISRLLDHTPDITGIVHVTGGGVRGNLSRVLAPSGTGAILDDLHVPHDFMLEAAA